MQCCDIVTEVPSMDPSSGLVPEPIDRRAWGAVSLGRYAAGAAAVRGGQGLLSALLGLGLGGRRPVRQGGLKDCGGLVVVGRTSLSRMHFKHPCPYAGTPERVANSAQCMQWLTAGPTGMIEQDLAEVAAHV
jgi:hypothetical protein